MANSDFAVNTYSYVLDYTATQCLEELAGLGFTDFELMMYPGHAWPNQMNADDREKLKARVKKLDIRINSLNQPNVDINLAAATPEMRQYSFAIVESIIELAGDLDVPWVVIGPGKVNPLMPASQQSVLGHFHDSLDELIKAAQRAGTRILVENMPFAFLPDAASLMEAIEGYKESEVGIVYDIANGAFIDEEIREGLQRTRRRLDLVHVSDTTRKVYKHDPIGKGDIDFQSVGEDLEAVGWHEKPVLEIIGRSADPKQEILEGARRLEDLGWAKKRSPE